MVLQVSAKYAVGLSAGSVGFYHSMTWVKRKSYRPGVKGLKGIGWAGDV